MQGLGLITVATDRPYALLIAPEEELIRVEAPGEKIGNW